MQSALDRACQWLADNVADLHAPLSTRLIAAGRSNLTYVVEDSRGRQLIVRRPPGDRSGDGKSHDIRREHRVLLAMSGIGLPVPRPIAFCSEASVLGAAFVVMEHVAGHVLRTRADAAKIGIGARSKASAAVIEALLRIHDVDVDETGLGDLSRHSGYLQRQLQRWSEQVRIDADSGQTSDVTVLAETHEMLRDRVPSQQRVSVVHGDFRLENLIITSDGTVAAVLDWELCTLGDPLADLGILLASWAEPADPVLTIAELEPTRVAGFLSRAQLVDTYRAGSPLDLSDIAYYLAFGLWKLACVLHGVSARYAVGSVGGDLAGADQLGQIVGRLAAAARAQSVVL